MVCYLLTSDGYYILTSDGYYLTTSDTSPLNPNFDFPLETMISDKSITVEIDQKTRTVVIDQ